MKLLSLLLLLFLLCSCAATPQSRLLQEHFPASLPLALELTETPFHAQTEFQCGPAALATMLDQHVAKTDIDALSRQIYLPARKGSLQIEIQSAARRHALLPYLLQPQLEVLLSEIAAGNPVLVLQNLGLDWYPKWHYAVVIGYDLQRAEIILRSGTIRRRITSFEVFERTWQRAGFWSLVILPPEQIPHSASPQPYLKAAFAFEETGSPELAHVAYRSAVKQWPDSADSWLMLGNSAFLQRNWELAIDAFRSATLLNPESTTGWNNLAYALHSNGCQKQALSALECGLRVAANDPNLLDSIQDIKSAPLQPQQSVCPAIGCE